MTSHELHRALDHDFYREKVGLILSREEPPAAVVARMQAVLRDHTPAAHEITLVLVRARLDSRGAETPVNEWHIAGLEPFLNSGQVTGRKLCIYGPLVRDGNVRMHSEDIRNAEFVTQALHRARIAFDAEGALANYIAEQDAFTRSQLAARDAAWAEIGGDLHRVAAGAIDDLRDASTTREERIEVERFAEESRADRDATNYAFTGNLQAVNSVQPRFV